MSHDSATRQIYNIAIFYMGDIYYTEIEPAFNILNYSKKKKRERKKGRIVGRSRTELKVSLVNIFMFIIP